MRLLGTVPNENFLISIHFYNEKFLLKIEAGPYEQCYKFTKEMAADEEAVRTLVTPEFLQQVKEVFDKMHENLKSVMLNGK